MSRKNRAERRRIILGLLPLLIPFLAIFGCGLFITALQSVGLLMFSYSYDDFLFAYRHLINDKWFLESAFYSLYVAASASFISLFLGTLFAYQIWKLPARLHGGTVIYKIPLILPHIAVGFIAVIILSKTGVISSIFHQVGIISNFQEFPALLYSSGGFDLIGAYVYKETPFVMVMIYGVLCRFDKRIIESAVMLGASPARIFFSLVLPFLVPVINASFIILFVFTFGGFDLPFVLGDSHPGMLSIKVYDYFFQKDISARPIAMAMLTLMFVFSLIFIIGYLKISKQLERGVRKL